MLKQIQRAVGRIVLGGGILVRGMTRMTPIWGWWHRHHPLKWQNLFYIFCSWIDIWSKYLLVSSEMRLTEVLIGAENFLKIDHFNAFSKPFSSFYRSGDDKSFPTSTGYATGSGSRAQNLMSHEWGTILGYSFGGADRRRYSLVTDCDCEPASKI